MTTTNSNNLLIQVMDLNTNCQHEVVSAATGEFLYQVSILENRLAGAFERGTIKKENIERINNILVAIEDMNHHH